MPVLRSLAALAGAGRLARMAGSSLAAPDAVAWVTDFVNAAYYARPAAERDVDDLRLAVAILTTRWARSGRRLRATDVLAFHRAFGLRRLRARGRLDRAALLAGAAWLHGDWFAGAYADEDRRAYGVVFPTVAERAAFDPGRRREHGALGPLTPPRAPAAEQTWHTYPPVAVPDLDGLLALLRAPERWPDAGCALGRFTPLGRGGLAGQAFEIDVIADTAPRAPLFTRGYVTATAVLDDADPAARADWLAALEQGGEVVPAGGELRLGLELTTHAGHFLGAARSNLVLWSDADGAWIRDVGVWDPLPLGVRQAYWAAGRAAQHDFWGGGAPERSLLHQLAAVGAG